MGWFKNRMRRWLQIDKEHEECRRAHDMCMAEVRTMKHLQEKYLELIHGAVDVHVATPMLNWAVFVMRGNGRASDRINVVDLSHMAMEDIVRLIGRVDMRRDKMRIDAPPGMKSHLRQWSRRDA
jgi:hypothetical protein